MQYEYDDGIEEADFLTREEAVALLGVAKQTLANWQKKGIITPYTIGVGRPKLLFKTSEIYELRDKLTVPKRVEQ